MKKKIIIALSVIIALIVILVVLMSLTNQNAPGGKNTLVKSIYLEKIPAGTQFMPGMEGIFATTFKMDDQIALSGEASFIGKAQLTAKIIKEGETDGPEAMPSMLLKPGIFGFCCIGVPQELGNYSLHFYTEGMEESLSPLNFEVAE
jgi:hypothetical protein